MSENKKILYGDHFGYGINEDVPPPPVPSPEPSEAFRFDSTEVKFDSLFETFDEQ